MVFYIEHRGRRLLVRLDEVSINQFARALALGAGRCDTRGNELANCRSCGADASQQYLDAAQVLRAVFDQLAEANDKEPTK